MIKNDSKALKIVLLILSIMLLFSGVTCRSCHRWGGSGRMEATSLDLDDIDRIAVRSGHGSASVRIEEGPSTRIEGDIRSWHEEKDGGVRSVTMELGSRPVTLTVAHGHELHELEVKTVSGNITMEGMDGIDDVTLKTASGKIEVEDVTIYGDLEAATTSGKVELRNVRAKEIGVCSTSGTVRVDAEATEEISAESVSGSVELVTGMTPEVETKTISGSIDIESGLTCPDVHFKSVSGHLKFNGDTVTGIGQHGNTDGKISIDTVSGNATLRTK